MQAWRGFGMHLSVPDLASLNVATLLLGAGAIIALLRFHLNLIATLTVRAFAGLGLKLSGLA